MMPMPDPDRFRRLERELEVSAERERRLRHARDGRAGAGPDVDEPTAAVTRLPELVPEEDWAAFDREREQTPA